MSDMNPDIQGDNRADRADVKTRFKKGDPRINRRGRPKSFDEFRREALKIMAEVIESPEGDRMTRVHAILLDWATSKDVRKQQLIIEYAFGKVPNEHSGTVKVETYQDEIIALLKAGKITPADVIRELGAELSRPILLAVGVAVQDMRSITAGAEVDA